MDRPDAMAPWVLGAATVVVVLAPVLAFEAFFYSDFTLLHHPVRWWHATTLADAGAPWWSAALGLGTPVVADPRAGTFYPPHLFLLVRPSSWGLSALVVAHLGLALFGCMRLVRALGGDAWSGLLCGGAFAIDGAMLCSVPQLPSLFAWAWVPLILEGAAGRRFGWTSVALAMVLLAGAPLVFVAALVMGLLLAPSAALIGAAALALGLSAVQILPTASLLPHLAPAAAVDLPSVTPSHLLGFLFPPDWNPEATPGRHYLGVVPLVLLPLGLRRRGALALALPLCLLPIAVPYAWLVEAWRLPASLVVAVLGGVGCAALASADGEDRALASTVAVAVCLMAGWFALDGVSGAAHAVAVAALSLAILWWRPQPALFALLALVDVGVAGRPLVWTTPPAVTDGANPMRALLGTDDPVVARHPLLNQSPRRHDLASLARATRHDSVTLRGNTGLRAGLRTLHARTTARVAHDRNLEAWFWDDPKRAGRVLGVGFVLLPAGAPIPDGYRAQTHLEALEITVAAREGELLPEVFCATELGPYACATREEGDAWRIRTPEPTVLVRRQAWAPGWRAAGRDVERALGTLQAVSLEPGEHLVRFTYRPPGLALGATVSGLSMLLLVAIGWYRRASWRRNTSSPVSASSRAPSGSTTRSSTTA